MSQVVSQRARRARTDEQKLIRRQAILDAADQHFSDVGYEAFSMAKLAKLAGVAKGTLYLYFETREEVFLELYVDKIARWGNDFTEKVTPGMGDESFARLFLTTAKQDPTLIPLLLRLDSIIEHNVSIEKLIISKRALRLLMDKLTGPVASVLKLDTAQAFDALSSLASLLVGTVRRDEGPDLEEEALPDDVLELMAAFSSDETFITNARRILAGIRSGI